MMRPMIVPKSRFSMNSGFRLQFEPHQGQHVLLYPEGMVELSDTAADVLRLCDCVRTYTEMLDELARRYDGDGVADDVRDFLEEACVRGWINVH